MPTTLNASRYIIPLIPLPSGKGYLTVIITYGNPYMDLIGPGGTGYTATAGTFTLSRESRIVTGMGPLKKKVNDDDGDITADNITLTFQDRYTFKGTHSFGGIEQLYTLEGTGRTFIENIFRFDGTYYVWLQYTNESYVTETFFAGEINPLSIPKKYTFLHAPHTSNERRFSEVELQLINSTARLKNLNVEQFVNGIPDIVDAITEAEVDSSKPFYGGFIPADFSEGIYGGMFEMLAANISDWDSKINNNASWKGYVNLARFGGAENDTYPTPDFPKGVWGITIPQILDRVCTVAGFKTFDPADFIPAFQYVRPEFNDVDNVYTYVIAPPDELAINYNWVFGVSPFDGSEFESPISYKRNSSLSDLLKSLLWQFGCYNWSDIDQTDGSTILRLLPRNQSNGPIPTNWVPELDDAQEAPRKVKARKVEVKNANAKASFICPGDATGESKQIEMKYRVKPWGNTVAPTWRIEHLIYDGGLPIYDQDLTWRIEHAGQEDNIHPNGWVAASYLYWRNPTDTNIAYPGEYAGEKLGTWEGYYTVQAQTEKAGVYEGRGNALYSACQFYTREVVGAPILMQRRYAGFLDDSGSIRGVRPNMTANIQVNGVLRSFKAKEIEQDIWNATTLVTYEEVIDYDTTDDLFVAEVGDDGQETSGGGTGGGNPTANPNIGGAGQIPQYLQLVNSIPCTATTVVNISLTGAIGRSDWVGAFVDDGARILVNAQTDKTQNGIYIADLTGAWARATDAIYNRMIIPVAFRDNLYNSDARAATQKGYTLVDYMAEYIPPDTSPQIFSTEKKPISILQGTDKVHFIPKGSFPIIGETVVVAKAVATANVDVTAQYSDTPGGTPPALVADGTMIDVGDIVALVTQTTTSENGLWVMQDDYKLTRVPFNVSTFTALRVMYGTQYAGSLWDYVVLLGGASSFRARTHWAVINQTVAAGWVVEEFSNYIYTIPTGAAPGLPPLATAFAGQRYIFKNTGIVATALNPTPGELIDGGAGAIALPANGIARVFAPVGGNSWYTW
jgi:hypothetical protein